MDNLSRAVREAQRLGYGVHYGRYKVDYPHTADHSVDLDPPKYPSRKCEECGVEFIPTRVNQRYCTEECKRRRTQRLNYHRRCTISLPIGPAICPICGDSFDRQQLQQILRRSCAESDPGEAKTGSW